MAAEQAKPDESPTTEPLDANYELFRRRRINYLLDVTQALIALAVTGVTLYVSARLALAFDSAGATAASLLLSNAFFLVIGFYFGRSNPRPGQRATDVPQQQNGRSDAKGTAAL